MLARLRTTRNEGSVNEARGHIKERAEDTKHDASDKVNHTLDSAYDKMAKDEK